MYIFALTLHVIAVMLVIGTLFVQSLSVVFRLRLSNQVADRGDSVCTASCSSTDLLPSSGCGSCFRGLSGRDSGTDQ